MRLDNSVGNHGEILGEIDNKKGLQVSPKHKITNKLESQSSYSEIFMIGKNLC